MVSLFRTAEAWFKMTEKLVCIVSLFQDIAPGEFLVNAWFSMSKAKSPISLLAVGLSLSQNKFDRKLYAILQRLKILQGYCHRLWGPPFLWVKKSTLKFQLPGIPSADHILQRAFFSSIWIARPSNHWPRHYFSSGQTLHRRAMKHLPHRHRSINTAYSRRQSRDHLSGSQKRLKRSIYITSYYS